MKTKVVKMFSMQQHLMRTLQKLTKSTTAATTSLATTATTATTRTIPQANSATSQLDANDSNCKCNRTANGAILWSNTNTKAYASELIQLANRVVKANRSLKCDVTLTRKPRAAAAAATSTTTTTTGAAENERLALRNYEIYTALFSRVQQRLQRLTFARHRTVNSCSSDNSCSNQRMSESNNVSSQVVLLKRKSTKANNYKNIENREEHFSVCANSKLVDCGPYVLSGIGAVRQKVSNYCGSKQKAIHKGLLLQHPAILQDFVQQQQQQFAQFHTENPRYSQSKQNQPTSKQTISMSSLAIKPSAAQQAADDGSNKQILISGKELQTATSASASASTSASALPSTSSAEILRKISTTTTTSDRESPSGISTTSVHSSSAKKPCFNASLTDIVQFMEIIGNLKHTKRTGWVLRDINDCESISGHMYRMSILTFLLDGSEGVNQIRCMELALVHDLAESLVGDITPFCGVSKNEKRALEFKAMEDICKLIEPRGKRIMELFEEYENGESAESKFVKDLDRLDMIMQAFEYEKRDNCLLKHQEFFDSTEGKFHHPFIKKLVNEIYEQRNKLAQDTGVSIQHKHSITESNTKLSTNATKDDCCTSSPEAATTSKSSVPSKSSSPSTT